ncbi:nitronate monooxygenase [Desulfonema magnum]|uniref:Oxygenase domain-containing protein n=1 Tax=Desulfonema magnum TaxID=45655 RepID=A0A975BFY0_9BACT|nr:nitronate monooxygenase [Desulfonema magnum]QTA84573.1 oxygenase domain-containing protein [Desulfonema magnum]
MKIFKKLPEIIQGGMGIGVSNWRLAKTVSKQGQIGVVSGVAIDSVFARRLQLGDNDGSIRRALSNFPWPDMVRRVLDAYFIPGGKSAEKPFKLIPMPNLRMKRSYIELVILANFVEVFLAKEGHDGLVGINYLEKIQLPTLPSLLGSMLAGVNFVLMGAGIPLAIPGALDGLSHWEPVELNLHIEDNTQRQKFVHHFDPKEFLSGKLPELTRPNFFAIISSDIVAKSLARKATGNIDGFIVENHTAGGHNAPPRRTKKTRHQSAPQYGEKDIPDIEKIRDLGRPFWLAGGYASPEKLKEALDLEANGIQVGTAFGFCNESAMLPEIKQEVLRQYINGKLKIFTDFKASPTGYPFKLVSLKNKITTMENHSKRKRICDMGYLRQAYCKGQAEIGFRCPAEPMEKYIRKGGSPDDTKDKQCLCNGLMATIGLGQTREDDFGAELPLITTGEDFSFVPHVVKNSVTNYSATDVIAYIKS